MAQVQVARSAGKQWFALLALIGAAMAAVLWWWSHRDDAAVSEAVTASAPAAPQVVALAKPVALVQQPDAMPSTEAGMVAQQTAAALVVARAPAMKPITGPVTERPEFVSEMEWQMLKGVSQQHPTPQAELTRLVNKLRFMKQLELWQSMAHSKDMAKRQLLAEQLLDDLPQRVVNADLDKPEAQKLQASLLKDAVSDEQARKKRADVETRRLGASAAS
ncbi:hypothetical protein [Aquabacterium sp.]|uniref:hypothetical protein n=1 Tax=Aquabacterium sp. TaxID=1872578 RepID=UPI0019AF8C04|nr:hypothetical protein [Aquabacterium sp.]MBC7700240.1 hypothetical protein [Aquabacterium sp.]